VIDCGNSGTGVRLIMGCMATTPITATFTGDASLAQAADGAGDRSAGAVRRAGLRARGRAAADDGGGGGRPGAGALCDLPVPSAQVKSAVLLAG
jgi:3-phosphoshikimate 1-carboxyvinyltransferase